MYKLNTFKLLFTLLYGCKVKNCDSVLIVSCGVCGPVDTSLSHHVCQALVMIKSSCHTTSRLHFCWQQDSKKADPLRLRFLQPCLLTAGG